MSGPGKQQQKANRNKTNIVLLKVFSLDTKFHQFLIVLAAIATEALAGAILSGHAWIPNLEPREGRNNDAQCSTVCGSPPVKDCTETIEAFIAVNTELCAVANYKFASPKGNCYFALVPSQSVDNGGTNCISANDFEIVASNLVKAFPGVENAGGCYGFSDGKGLCVMTLEDSCLPQTLA